MGVLVGGARTVTVERAPPGPVITLVVEETAAGCVGWEGWGVEGGGELGFGLLLDGVEAEDEDEVGVDGVLEGLVGDCGVWLGGLLAGGLLVGELAGG